ncbi:MAG: hypothetical protein AB7H80_11190 [Candidatus Kapaibacterium sp.]
MRRYYDSIVGDLPELVRETLQRIPNFGRKVLAANVYFRRVEELEEGWSWSASQVRDYKKTEEYAHMLVEIEKVKREFAENNPGYSLGVNIAARSLETQIAKWNSVSSVGKCVAEFMDSCRVEFSDSIYGETPDTASISRFRAFMQRYEFDEDRVPTVATPGLSKHGQLRAFDFKIMKGKTMIAGASSATISSRWDGAGWTAKLREAVVEVSEHFDGPLDNPYEPWHYNYHPDPNHPKVMGKTFLAKAESQQNEVRKDSEQ